MPLHPLAGKPVPSDQLIDVDKLVSTYYDRKPELDDPGQRVSFGTSGHRGSSFDGAFNEAHIIAVTQAVCEYRAKQGINGPLFVGKDTHGLSGPAERTAIEVLAANNVTTILAEGDGFTPTPVISRAILSHNQTTSNAQADGIVITPSHNPPRDGGFKYNPPHGGPAGTDATSWIQARANELVKAGTHAIQRVPYDKALQTDHVSTTDFITPYVNDLSRVIDFDAIRDARLSIGADPIGGAGVQYWQPIAERHNIDLTVVNDRVDPAFSFLTLDHDGKIRMDCSSPYAMASLVQLKDKYDIAFGNDTDADRHGIVTPSAGLMNPNHYLAVAIQYLFTHRDIWPKHSAIGKTLVSSSMIDRVAKVLDRNLCEVPVGFKWFVDGLLDGSMGFGGEESAGASFLRRDGSVWTTDKDGIIMGLLAAEITAIAGKDPGAIWTDFTARFGTPYYKRLDRPATPEQKTRLKKLSPNDLRVQQLAGQPILDAFTRAPGNDAEIGGLKVSAQDGWFAARPSGTENVYKIYAESFQSEAHLEQLLEEAAAIVDGVLN